MESLFFNAQHAPIGAFSSFTLGYRGRSGGPGFALGGPACANVYVGLQEPDGGICRLLPFYRFAPGDGVPDENETAAPFPEDEIERQYRVCSDRWKAGELTFTIFSQARPVPEPGGADRDVLKEALVPAVLAELEVDNRKGKKARRAVFGFDGTDPYFGMRHVGDEASGVAGVAQGASVGILCGLGTARSAIDFSLENILTSSPDHWGAGLGNTAALLMEIPAGRVLKFRFAVCFYHGGEACTGIHAHYYYASLFGSLEEAGAFALEHFESIRSRCLETDGELEESGLPQERKFMLGHAVHSYYGSTELLEADGEPVWIVNEGEYRMINTLDLTADQVFFEMKMNPWTVRSVLDLYLNRYSYHDSVRFPGDPAEYPGGISFTHDMGVANVFAPPGRSAYEKGGGTGIYSYMGQEELVNWLCCALLYAQRDPAWAEKRMDAFRDCLASMENRDDPDPEKRDGVMSLDSSKTEGGAEITTYDSLDPSLGRSRGGTYLAGKCWAAYVMLEKLFLRRGEKELGKRAGIQAERCADTVARNLNGEGFLPAALDSGGRSRVIPAIEGLAFPYFAGDLDALDLGGRFGPYLSALKKHLETVLQKGVCLFEDGGWKLSSESDNSWLSKIYLCEFVAEKILKVRADYGKADRAHAGWLLRSPQSFWCWSDQIWAGEARGSRYYPRGVTSILWMEK